MSDPNFPGFCHDADNEGHEVLMGDFDADGRTDLVCRMQGGAHYLIALSGKFRMM